MQVGDIVSRKSYNNDIWFKVSSIKGDSIIIQGLLYRLVADAHYSDLQKVNTRGEASDGDIELNSSSTGLFKTWYLNQCNYQSNIKNSIDIDDNLVYKKYGKILHIDGDKSYLSECLSKYEKLGVSVVGVSIEESKQPEVILKLLKQHKPNILVITGHDSMLRNNNINDIDSYKNSKYFIESVKIAREYNSNYDDLVIFAGGCKSYYELLMQAGANFATSPNRVLVHVIDPVIIACKIATTSVREILDIDSIVKNTTVGISGIGGIETRGNCRECKPKF